MAQGRIRFTPTEIANLSLATILALAAAIFSFIAESAQGETPTLLFFPLMPGLITGLFITGGHGGTATQEAIAPWIASVVNAAFYFLLVLIGGIIWRKLISRPTAYRQKLK
jgi:hypothetical protein